MPIALIVIVSARRTPLLRARLSVRTLRTLPVPWAIGRQFEFIENVTPPLVWMNYPRNLIEVLILLLPVVAIITLVFRRIVIVLLFLNRGVGSAPRSTLRSLPVLPAISAGKKAVSESEFMQVSIPLAPTLLSWKWLAVVN